MYSRDDSAINEENRPIKCESSPPTPRSLRLERGSGSHNTSAEDTPRSVSPCRATYGLIQRLACTGYMWRKNVWGFYFALITNDVLVDGVYTFTICLWFSVRNWILATHFLLFSFISWEIWRLVLYNVRVIERGQRLWLFPWSLSLLEG